MKTAKDYADEIMARIHEDMAKGIVPRDVGSFSRLHDYRDANMYVLEAMGETDTYEAESETDEHNALVNAIMDEVNERLAAEAIAINGGEPLEWREDKNWPYIGNRPLHMFTASRAVAEDGTWFTRCADGLWRTEDDSARAQLSETIAALLVEFDRVSASARQRRR